MNAKTKNVQKVYMRIEATRNKFLQVASFLFSRFGFRKTSMDEIARKARKAKGSLYYYFANKEELFTEILKKELNDLKNLFYVCSKNSTLSPLEQLKSYLLQRMEYIISTVSYQEAIRADFYERLDFVDLLREEFNKWEETMIYDLLEKIFRENQLKHSFSVNHITKAIMFLLKSVELFLILQPKNSNNHISFQNILNLCFDGLTKQNQEKTCIV